MPPRKNNKPAAVKKPGNLKSEYLMELAERFAYWSAKGTKEAMEYATAYERMMCAFTMPPKEGKTD